MIIQTQLKKEEVSEFSLVGVVEVNEMIETIKTEYANVCKNVLWNLKEADVSALTRDHMWQIAEVAKEHAIHDKTAFVGVSNSVFASLRMYEAHSEMAGVPLIMRVFRSRKDALEWLAAPLPES